MNLRGDAMSNKVVKKFFVVEREHVLNQTEHVDWRVGKILKPVLTPTRWNNHIMTTISIIIIIK